MPFLLQLPVLLIFHRTTLYIQQIKTIFAEEKQKKRTRHEERQTPFAGKTNAMKGKNICLIATILLWNCMTTGCTNEEEEKAEAKARKFAEAYFNLHFDDAFAHCTPDSRKWLHFRATNITESDLQAMRSSLQPATVHDTEIKEFNDSTAIVRCTLYNVLAADSLEQRKGRVLPEAVFDIPLSRTQGNKWQVRMEGPLQNAE